MKKNLHIWILLLIGSNLTAQNGTRPDYNKVIVGSEVVRTIDVLANDNAVAGKNYQLTGNFIYSNTSPSTTIEVLKVGNNVTYKAIHTDARSDTFYYIARDINSNTLDTNFVVITKDVLSLDLYPGDANKDNICNNIDVLNIGIAYGRNEIVREGKYFNDDWAPVRAYDWTLTSLKSNYRYADANGDGIIDSMGDIETIFKNYNRTINFVNVDYSPTGGESFQIIAPDTLKVDGTQGLLQIKINLGATTNKVTKAYGIAFTVKYNNTHIKPENISYKASKWFADQASTLNFSRINATNGELDITLVRKDGINKDGYGELGVVDVVIIDELGAIANGVNTSIEVAKPVLIDSNYKLLPITLPASKPIHLVKKSSSNITNGLNNKSIRYSIQNQSLSLKNESIKPIEVSIYNILGKLIATKTIQAMQNNDIDISQWTQGVYLLKAANEVYKFTK